MLSSTLPSSQLGSIRSVEAELRTHGMHAANMPRDTSVLSPEPDPDGVLGALAVVIGQGTPTSRGLGFICGGIFVFPTTPWDFGRKPRPETEPRGPKSHGA